MKEDVYCKISDLKELGWTDSLIKKYLGEPDWLATNPVFRSKAPMRLYLIGRVKQVTEEQELAEALNISLEKRVKRSEVAIAAAQKKREKMLEWIASLKIDIPQYSYPELIKSACAHYNAFQEWRQMEKGYFDDFRAATPDSDADFLYRITHNFLRHTKTSYEQRIDQMFGQVGKQEGYEALKARITTAIDHAYPDLISFLKSGDPGVVGNGK